ncbi:hypothetical protein NCS52_00969400 [Fusarium sp. LHS14.1]|nr:hypothetical protein NCS52_00969400 [Fusarium sp. LHS14.1]
MAQISSIDFPTDLTIRLHHTKSSFTATFKMRLSPGKIHKTKSAVCEAEHLSGRSKPQPTIRTPLRPFRKNNLDRKSVSEEVRAKMLSPLTPSALQGQGLGHIYILRSPMDLSTVSVLKTGFSKYHPEHRAHELASCIPVTEVVAHTPLLPHAMRVEALIHTELADKRKILACGQCGHDHREWFEISHAESREVVVKWSRWILCEPHLKGNLSDEWWAYLQEKDFSTADPETTISRQWMEILKNFPRTVSDISQQTQLATLASHRQIAVTVTQMRWALMRWISTSQKKSDQEPTPELKD